MPLSSLDRSPHLGVSVRPRATYQASRPRSQPPTTYTRRATPDTACWSVGDGVQKKARGTCMERNECSDRRKQAGFAREGGRHLVIADAGEPAFVPTMTVHFLLLVPIHASMCEDSPYSYEDTREATRNIRHCPNPAHCLMHPSPPWPGPNCSTVQATQTVGSARSDEITLLPERRTSR